MALNLRSLLSPTAFSVLCLVAVSTAPVAAQDCTGSATGGFSCNRIPSGDTATIGTVFSASEAGGRRNVSLTLIEELAEEEAAPAGGGGGDAETGLELFAAGGYGWQDYDTENVLGSDGDSWSGLFGASYRGDNFVVGIAGDATYTDSDFDLNGGSRDSDEYGGQIFGTFFPLDNLFISAGARIATISIDTERATDSPTNVARGDTDGMKYGLSGGVGYNIPIATATVVGISGWLAWERTEIDGYSETGAVAPAGNNAGPPNLTFRDDDFNTLDGTLRAEIARAFLVGNALVVPSARVDFVHEFESDTRTIEAFLPQSSANNASFISYRTNEADENYFRLGASLSVAFDQGASLTAVYAGDFGHSWREEHVITLGLSYRF